MDTTITPQTNTDQAAFDEVFDSLPEGVEEFMWSEEYDQLIDGIQKTLSLTDAQKTLVQTKGYELLAQLKDMEAAAKELIDSGMSQELAAKTLYLLDQVILQPVARVIAEPYEPSDDEEEDSASSEVPTVPTEITPQSDDVMASLRARMTQSATIARVRTTITPAPASSTPASSAPATPTPLSSSAAPTAPAAPTIDPYRELPE